jgi:hypothetical protein
MRKHNLDFVEVLLILVWTGALIPLAVVVGNVGTSDTAGETAILLTGNHVFTLLVLAGTLAMDYRNPIARVAIAVYMAALSALTGVALFIALCGGLGAEMDPVTVAAGVIVVGTVAISIFAFTGFVKVFKKNA